MIDGLENARLKTAMDRLASENARIEPPAEMESVLLAEFDRVHLRRKRFSWAIPALAFAASLAIAVFVQYRSHGSAPSALPPAPSEASATEDSDQPFVPIPYVTPLAPYERAQVVRMEVPVAALIAAGLPVRTADSGAQAEADVVVGQDGRPRAVRLIAISSVN